MIELSEEIHVQKLGLFCTKQLSYGCKGNVLEGNCSATAVNTQRETALLPLWRKF